MPVLKTFSKLLFLPLVLLTISSNSLAQSKPFGERSVLTNSEVRQIALTEAPQKAAEWSITEADWVRYREIMNGPRGLWSPNADPITVLGAHATTTAERNRLADAFVKLEYQRVLGELTFQQAVDAAWPRNFPGQKRVNPSPFQTTNTQQTNNILLASQVRRYALVVENDCRSCDDKLREYIALVQKDKSGRVLDVFVRKTQNDDGKLREWVDSNGIPVNLIQAGRVTVNHGERYEQGAVPAVWVQRGDGQWKQVD